MTFFQTGNRYEFNGLWLLPRCILLVTVLIRFVLFHVFRLSLFLISCSFVIKPILVSPVPWCQPISSVQPLVSCPGVPRFVSCLYLAQWFHSVSVGSFVSVVVAEMSHVNHPYRVLQWTASIGKFLVPCFIFIPSMESVDKVVLPFACQSSGSSQNIRYIFGLGGLCRLKQTYHLTVFFFLTWTLAKHPMKIIHLLCSSLGGPYFMISKDHDPGIQY